jgi:hypothetical protein
MLRRAVMWFDDVQGIVVQEFRDTQETDVEEIWLQCVSEYEVLKQLENLVDVLI